MSPERLSILMLIFGGFFLITGMVVRLGLWKDWYWKKFRLVYGYIPMGLLFIFWYFKPLITQRVFSEFFVYQLPSAILLIISTWLSARPPRFIKPKWVAWVESHSNRVVDGMLAEVNSGADWVSKVKTRQTVDAWARTIKNKLPKKAR